MSIETFDLNRDVVAESSRGRVRERSGRVRVKSVRDLRVTSREYRARIPSSHPVAHVEVPRSGALHGNDRLARFDFGRKTIPTLETNDLDCFLQSLQWRRGRARTA